MVDLASYLSEQLASQLAHIKTRCSPLLSQTVGHFTDHSIHHSERVITILNRLLEDLMKHEPTESNADLQPLNETEIFVLLAAVYLHDVGMHYQKGSSDLREVRAHHHEHSYTMIVGSVRSRDDNYDLGVPDGHADTIAVVARAHCIDDITGDEWTSRHINIGHRIRVRLLCALLQLADRLDVTYERVDVERLKTADVDLTSQMHWWRHYYVQGVGFVRGSVRVTFRLPRIEYERYRNVVPTALLKDIHHNYDQLRDDLWNYEVRINIPTDVSRHKCLKCDVPLMPPEVFEAMRAYAAT